MLGTAAGQEDSTDTTWAAAANLLHQWRGCLVHLWVHTQAEIRLLELSLPAKGIFIATVSHNSTLLQWPHRWSPSRRDPLHQDSPACYSQSHSDYNIAVLTLQILMADWRWSEVVCMVLSSIRALEMVSSRKLTVTCTLRSQWHLQMVQLTAKGGFACALTAGALICLFWLIKSPESIFL